MKNFSAYLKNARKELGKVHWPDRPKVVETTLVVTVSTAIFAAYLSLVDAGIYRVFQLILY